MPVLHMTLGKRVCYGYAFCIAVCITMVQVQEEIEKQQAYFEHLETKEALEQMMQSVTEKRVSVFRCAKVCTADMCMSISQSVVCVHVYARVCVFV